MSVGDWFRGLRGRYRESSRGNGLPFDRVPFHVAIIMDGNGRWASRRKLPTLAGHRAGTRALKRVVRAARRIGIRQLTVFSFSTENWTRPKDEVEGLMELLEEMIDTEVPELHGEEVKVVFVGRREGLSPGLRRKMAEAEALTADNQAMTLFIALNYGGRAEILDAFQAALLETGSVEAVTEEDIDRHLYAPEMQDADLIIRTSGEHRLSNFLLWESAYSELYFSDTLWPDFGAKEFERALRDFASRQRRFGARQAVDGA